GHGYFLEEGTEVNNRLYSNVGIYARAAVVGHIDTELYKDANPRKVPGILAKKTDLGGNPLPADNFDNFPFSTDVNHPTLFWVMNAWNDFRGNMAAGAGVCGVCYWMVPGRNSGMSMNQKWEGYASLQ